MDRWPLVRRMFKREGEGAGSVSVRQLRRAIQRLPADPPVHDPDKWYLTQKEHWLGWLGQYHGPGAYGRKTNVKRDAKYAYNHIVEYRMLLWLIEAAGIEREKVLRAKGHGGTLYASRQVRRHPAACALGGFATGAMASE